MTFEDERKHETKGGLRMKKMKNSVYEQLPFLTAFYEYNNVAHASVKQS